MLLKTCWAFSADLELEKEELKMPAQIHLPIYHVFSENLKGGVIFYRVRLPV